LTWYGLHATVNIGPGFVHKTGLGGFVIPHRPLVNWLLRKALKDAARYRLTFVHEFGHLQTAPMILVYGAATMAFYLITNRADLPGIMITLIGAQAAWEIASELYAVRSDPQIYKENYRGACLLHRLIFWILSSAFTLSGWIPTVLR
jgi:hypothetical protein